MDNLENIFSWYNATEPSIKDQILESFPGKKIEFILRLNYNKIRTDDDTYLGHRYLADHNDHYAIEEKNARGNRYGVEATKRVLRDGVLYNVHLYAGIDFITHVLSNDAVLMPALEVAYSEYEVNNIQQVIVKIQEIQRKEFAKRNWSITRLKRQLEERGLLVQPLGRRR
jgi:hypothetical protein